MSRPLTWVEVSKSAISHNIQSYKNIVGPDVKLAIVVKSNAYGHGIAHVASIAQEHDAVDYICVVALSEALHLREQNITKPLLVLSYIDALHESIITHDIDVVVYDLETAQIINDAAQRIGKPAQVHVKIDTGLSRMGMGKNSALNFIRRIKDLPYCNIRGIFTHLANSEHKDQQYVLHQLSHFDQILSELAEHNIEIPYKHSSCSAAVLSTHKTHYNFARLGIGTYGLWPSSDNKTLAHIHYPHFNLKPAMQWKTTVIHVKTVPPESNIGYDRTFQTNRETTIAVLPVGYYEGYDRKLSNRGVVIINDRPARIVGRISMNLTTIDVTDIPNVKGRNPCNPSGRSPPDKS